MFPRLQRLYGRFLLLVDRCGFRQRRIADRACVMRVRRLLRGLDKCPPVDITEAIDRRMDHEDEIRRRAEEITDALARQAKVRQSWKEALRQAQEQVEQARADDKTRDLLPGVTSGDPGKVGGRITFDEHGVATFTPLPGLGVVEIAQENNPLAVKLPPVIPDSWVSSEDHSSMPAYLAKLLEEARQTPAGRRLTALEAAEAAYVKELRARLIPAEMPRRYQRTIPLTSIHMLADMDPVPPDHPLQSLPPRTKGKTLWPPSHPTLDPRSSSKTPPPESSGSSPS